MKDSSPGTASPNPPALARSFVNALLKTHTSPARAGLLRAGTALPSADSAPAFEAWLESIVDNHIRGQFQRSKEEGMAVALRRLFAGSGESIQLTRLAAEGGVTRLTVTKLVDSLAVAGVIHISKAFHGGHARELTQFHYAYLLDPGLVTAARASLGLDSPTHTVLWEHAAVTVLRVLRPQPLQYWWERKGARIPCVCPADNGRVHAFVLGADDAASFDPEPFRALRVLHPMGSNFFFVPDNTGPEEREAFDLPVRVITPAGLAAL
ncbi:MAG: hypothetical protein JJU00_11955 [Opitutales bacterium]|nr:hypothetical protein [Opitutales bacterium]